MIDLVIVVKTPDGIYLRDYLWYYSHEEGAPGTVSVTCFNDGDWSGRGGRAMGREIRNPIWGHTPRKFWWKGIKMITLTNGKRFFV